MNIVKVHDVYHFNKIKALQYTTFHLGFLRPALELILVLGTLQPKSSSPPQSDKPMLNTSLSYFTKQTRGNLLYVRKNNTVEQSFKLVVVLQ